MNASQPATAPFRPATWQTSGFFALYLVLSLVGGAALGWALVQLLGDSGIVESLGAPRIMRRVQTLLAIALAPWLLKRIGWRGWRDLGWSVPEGMCGKRDFLYGFVLGMVVMGVMMVLGLALQVRVWDSSRDWTVLFKILSAFVVTGLGVGIIEETLARGVLFRSLARCWGAWASMGVTGIVFAYVHFLKARPEAFTEGVFAAVRSSLVDGLATDRVGVQMVNLCLLAIVLSVMVVKRGQIWMAVGFHCAVVGIFRTNSLLTDRNRDRIPGIWFGRKVEFTDGVVCTFVLISILIFLLWIWKKTPADASPDSIEKKGGTSASTT